MQLRRLGRTDLSIAPMVLGGNVFGWTADKKTSFAVLDRFAEAGLNAIDTADAYSTWVPGNKGGESETIIGEWMKARGNRGRIDRHHQGRLADGPGQGGPQGPLHRRGGRSVAEAPADRRDRPLSRRTGPTWRRRSTRRSAAYQRLIEKGKIRWCGASNLTVELLEAAIAAAKARGGAALRGAAARIQSRRPQRVRIGPRRPLHARGDRRHHLFQPRQGLPVGQVPQRGGPRPRARAAAASRPISIRAAFASSTRSTRSRRVTRPSRPKSRSPGSSRGRASPRRSPAPPRVEQVESLIRATELDADGSRHGGARQGQRALSAKTDLPRRREFHRAAGQVILSRAGRRAARGARSSRPWSSAAHRGTRHGAASCSRSDIASSRR